MKNKIYIMFILLIHTQLQSKQRVSHWVYNAQAECTYSSAIAKRCMYVQNPQHVCFVKLAFIREKIFNRFDTLKISNITKHTDNCTKPNTFNLYNTSWTTISTCVKGKGNLYNCNLTQTAGSEPRAFFYKNNICSGNNSSTAITLCDVWPVFSAKHTIEFDDDSGNFTLKYCDNRSNSFTNGKCFVIKEKAIQQYFSDITNIIIQ